VAGGGEAERSVLALRDLARGPASFAAVVALGERAVPGLEALLRGPPESIYQPRCLVADALAAIGGEAAFQALLRALSDSLGRELEPVTREAESAVLNRIAEHLGQFGDARAADPLLDALRAHPYTGCMRALVRLGDPRAVPLLVRGLDDDVAREEAVEALRAFPRAAEAPLVRHLREPQREGGFEPPNRTAGRAAAAALLGEFGGRPARAALEEATRDREAEVRLAAAVALARLAGEKAAARALPALVEALGGAAWFGADAAAEALVRLGPRATKALLAAVAAPREDPGASRRRVRAVEVLGRIGDPRAALALGELSSSADPHLRLAALAALEKIPGEEAALSLARFVPDADPAVRAEALRALARHGAAARPSGGGLAGGLARLASHLLAAAAEGAARLFAVLARAGGGRPRAGRRRPTAAT
jgi:HEAT repeat protein